MNNVYLGILLIDRIESAKSYQSAVKQIQHFLALHTSRIKLIETQSVLTLRPLYNNDEFTILKDCESVHTCYYRLSMQQPPAEPQLDFFQVCLECLLVLKQHFPSKIDIAVLSDNQNLKIRLEAMTEQNKGELSRRYLSNLKGLAFMERDITREELQDILYVLRTEQGAKVRSTALGLIARMGEHMFLALSEVDVEVIDQLANHEDYAKLANLCLAKLVRAKTMTVRDSRLTHKQQSVKFDEPNLLKSHLFQLKESANLQRIGFLVDKLCGHIPQLDTQELRKVDMGVYDTVTKQLSGKYPTNGSRNLVEYTTAVLKYAMQRRTVKSVSLLIQLISQTIDQPPTNQSKANYHHLRRAIQDFISEFADRCGERQSRELGQLIERSAQRDTPPPPPTLPLQSSRQTSRSNRHHVKSTYVAQ